LLFVLLHREWCAKGGGARLGIGEELPGPLTQNMCRSPKFWDVPHFFAGKVLRLEESCWSEFGGIPINLGKAPYFRRKCAPLC
jgi:hypothetical protein